MKKIRELFDPMYENTFPENCALALILAVGGMCAALLTACLLFVLGVL